MSNNLRVAITGNMHDTVADMLIEDLSKNGHKSIKKVEGRGNYVEVRFDTDMVRGGRSSCVMYVKGWRAAFERNKQFSVAIFML